MKLKSSILSIIFALFFITAQAATIVRLGPEYFPDPTRGKPVSSGSLYIGEPDLDPEIVANQIQVSAVQESGVTVPISQPISTGSGGVPLYNGSPVTLTVEASYSLKLLDSYGSQVYYTPNSFVQSSGVEILYLSNFDCDLSAAISTIGSTVATLVIDCNTIIADGTTETTPTTLYLNIINGGSIDGVAGGGTETLNVNGPFEAGEYQVIGINLRDSINFGDGAIEASIPEWFGAKGDADISAGTGTDNYAAITAAAASYDTIKLSDKIYGIEQTLIFEQDLTIINDNATILGIPYTTGPRNLIVAGEHTQVLTVNEALDATASRGENELYLPGTFLATLEVNEVILVNSDKEYIGDEVAININHAGELAKISTIEVDHVTIYGNLNDTYTTADNAKVVKVNTYTFDILGKLNLRSVANDVDGGALLTLRWVKDSTVNTGVISTHTEAVGINVYNSYNINVNTHMTVQGDGVVYSGASTNISIRGDIETKDSHCVAGSGGNDPAGIPWNIDVEVTALATGKAIDSHYGTGSIYIHDSEIKGLIGIGVSALYNTIADCRILARSDGIRIRVPVDNILDVESFIVKDCEIETTGNYGMRFIGNDIGYLEISDTTIKGAVASSVLIHDNSVIGKWKFSGNDFSDGESGLTIDGPGIELPSNMTISDSAFTLDGRAISFADGTDDVNTFANLESILITNCVVVADEVIVINNGGSSEKTLSLLTLDNVITNVDVYGVLLQDFSVTDMKLENIESTTATYTEFVRLSDAEGFNISVGNLYVTGSHINSAARVARGDAGTTVDRAIIGQNRLITNTIVDAANQGASYIEILSCANPDDPFISQGVGSPEGVVTASPGRIYMNLSGGVGTTFYDKETGTGNTGWIAK